MSWSTRFVFAFFAVLITQFISIAGQARSPWQDTATADAFIQSFLGTVSGSEAFTLEQLDDMSTIGDSLMTAMDTMTRNNKISQSKLQALDLGFASSMAEIAAVEQGGQSVDVKTNEIANALSSAFLQTTGTINTQFVDEIKNLSSIFSQAYASEVAYATAGSGNAATNTGYSAGPVYVSWQEYKGVPQEQGPEEFRFQVPSTAAVVTSDGFESYRQGGQAAQSPGGYGPVSATVSTAAADLGGYEQGGQGLVGPETQGQDRVASTRVDGNFVVSGQRKQDQGSVGLRGYGSGSAAVVAATPNYLKGYGQDQGFRGYGSAGPGFQEPVNTAATVVAGGYSQGRQDQGLLGSGAQGPGGYGPFSIAIALGGLGSYGQEVPVQEPPKSEFQGQGSAAIGELGVYDTGVQGDKGPGLIPIVSADTVGFGSYAPVIQGELQIPSKPGIPELRSASATSVTIGDNNVVRGNEGPYDLRIQGSGGSAATTTAVVSPSEIGEPGQQGGQVRSATGGTSAVAGKEYGINAQQSTIPDTQGSSGLGPLVSEGAAVTTNGLEGYGRIAQAPSGSGAQISDGYGPGNFAASTILGGYEVIAEGPSGPGGVSSTAASADRIEYGRLQRPLRPGNQGAEGVPVSTSRLEVYAPRAQVSSAPVRARAIELQDYRPVAQVPSAPVGKTAIGLQDYGPVQQAPSAPVGETALGMQDYGLVSQAPSAPEGATEIKLQYYGPVPQVPSALLGQTAIRFQDYRPVHQAPSAPVGETSIGFQDYRPVPQAPSAPVGATAIGFQDYRPVPQVPSAPEGATAIGLQDYGPVQQAPSAPVGKTAIRMQDYGQVSQSKAIRLQDYGPVPHTPSAPQGATAIRLQDYGQVQQAPSAPVGKTAIGMQDYEQVSQSKAIGLQDYGPVSQAPSAPERATAIVLQDYGPVPQAPSAPIRETAIGMQDYRLVSQAPSAPEGATEIRSQYYGPVPQVPSALVGETAIIFQDYRPVSQAPSAPVGEISIGFQDYKPVPQTPSAPGKATAIGLQDYEPVQQVPSAPVGKTAIGMQDYGQVSQSKAIGLQDYEPVPQAPSTPEGATAIVFQDYGPVQQAPSAPVGETAIGMQDYGPVQQVPSAPVGETAFGFQDYRPVPQAPSAPEGATSIGLQDYGPVQQAPSAPVGETAIGMQDYGPVQQVPSAPVGETAIGMQDYGQVSEATAIGMQDYALVSQAPSAPEGATENRLQYYGPIPQVPPAPEGATAVGIQDYVPVFQITSIGLQDYGPIPQSPFAPEGATTIASQDYVPVTQVPSAPEGATAFGLLQYYGQVLQAPSAPEGARATGFQDYRAVFQAPSAPERTRATGFQDYRPVPQAPSAPAGATEIRLQYYAPVAQAPSAPSGETAIELKDYGPVPQAPFAPEGSTAIGFQDYVPILQAPSAPEGATTEIGIQYYGPVSQVPSVPVDIERQYGPGESPMVATSLGELEGYVSAIKEPSGQSSQSLGGSSSGSAIIFSVVDGLGRYNQDAQGPSGPGAQGPGKIVEAPTTAGIFQEYRPVTQGPQRSSGSEGFYSYSVSLTTPGYRSRDQVPSGPSHTAFEAASRLSTPDSASRVSSVVSSLISSGPTNPVALSSVIDNAISQISAINPDLSDCEVLIQAVLEVFSALLNIYIASTWAR